MSSKKQMQLGMNPSTASGKLLRDILFKLAVDSGHKCFQCGNTLDRETFSIEHKVPWLDSVDPIGLYFDLKNIAFSHKSCNYSADRSSNKKYKSKEEARDAWMKQKNERDRKRYTPESRRDRYLRTGN